MTLGFLATGSEAQTTRYDFRIQGDFQQLGVREPDVVLEYDATEGVIVHRLSGIDSATLLYAPDDIVVTARLRFLDAVTTTDHAGLFLRDEVIDDIDSGYGFTISSEGDMLLLRTDGVTNQTTLGQAAATGLDPTANDVLLEARAVGRSLEFTAWEAGSAKPAPQIAAVDESATPHLDGGWIALVNSSFQAPPGSRVAFRSLELTAVPEPGGWILLAIGGVVIAAYVRRRRSQTVFGYD